MRDVGIEFRDLKYDAIFYKDARQIELGAIEVSKNTAWQKLDQDRTKLAIGLHFMLQLLYEDVRLFRGDTSKLETIGFLHGGIVTFRPLHTFYF